MKLYLIRHAIAADRDEFASSGQRDQDRPLTKGGIERLDNVVRGLVRLERRIDQIYTSPYLRAKQTAEIVAKAYSLVPRTLEALIPDSAPEELVPCLKKCHTDGMSSLAFVGHEPDLSRLVSWLTIGKTRQFLFFKKAGVCCLKLTEQFGPGRAAVVWSLGPSQLVKMGKKSAS